MKRRLCTPICFLALFVMVSVVAVNVGGLYAQTSASDESYKIKNGDKLEIITWKEPDFTREVMVRSDGKFTFPLLNDVAAAGLEPKDLKADIEEKLGQFVKGPNVTVIVKSPLDQKFYILGEVQGTGAYDFKPGLTVLQAFAMAGGFTEWSSKKKIILLRREGGQEKIYRINYVDIVKGKDFSQNIEVQPNDTIIVP